MGRYGQIQLDWLDDLVLDLPVQIHVRVPVHQGLLVLDLILASLDLQVVSLGDLFDRQGWLVQKL